MRQSQSKEDSELLLSGDGQPGPSAGQSKQKRQSVEDGEPAGIYEDYDESDTSQRQAKPVEAFVVSSYKARPIPLSMASGSSQRQLAASR